MQPLPNQTCPLCGGPNHCAAAATGSFSTRCWCQDAVVTPELLAKVPEADRGRACLCPSCVGVAAASSVPAGTSSGRP